MFIEYGYPAGVAWSDVLEDLMGLVTQGAAFTPGFAAPGQWSVEGEPPAGWRWGDNVLEREPAGDSPGVAYHLFPITGGAVDGIFATPFGFVEYGAPVNVWALFAGQNSAGGGMTSAAGAVRLMVTENAVACSFAYGAGRQLALLGECDGAYFGAGQYPRNFVMSTQAVVSGMGSDALAKVPYFPRVKNPAAAGDKTGLAACGLAFAAGISATNGWVYGINETLTYQALPLECFSSPKAAHLGYVRDVLLAPCKVLANDDVLMVDGEQYRVFRENATAAVAVAMKA